MSDQPRPADSPPDSAADRLDSWKEIAAYLKRDVSTVQRWEKKEGLPVHRHVHDKLGSVYAFRAELEDWRRAGHPIEGDVAAKVPVVRHSSWRRAIASAVVVVVGGLLVGLVVWRFWPVPAQPLSARFEYLLPEGQQFR